MIKMKDAAVKRAINKAIKYMKESPKKIEKLALSINASIKKRVQEDGKGISGLMKKYTPKYRAWKKGKGRRVAKRDLTFSGRMWSSLSVNQIGTKTRMFFAGKEEALKAEKNQSIDEFFGIASNEQSVINHFFKNVLKEII